jgi:hypothetical protein
MIKLLLRGAAERAFGVDGHVCEVQLVTAGFYAILVGDTLFFAHGHIQK